MREPAEAGEAYEHHRPGRGLGNRAANDEDTKLVGDRQVNVGSHETQIDNAIITDIAKDQIAPKTEIECRAYVEAS